MIKTTILGTLILMALLATGGLTACSNNASSKTKPTNQPANKTVTNTERTESKTPVDTNQSGNIKPNDPNISAISANSPTEVYKVAYAARQKKDVETLKKVLSKDMLEFFSFMGEAENKTVDDELRQLAEKPQAPTDETRNEKINGDTATLEYPDENGKWQTMDFVKENGNWKLTVPNVKSPNKMNTNGKNK